MNWLDETSPRRARASVLDAVSVAGAVSPAFPTSPRAYVAEGVGHLTARIEARRETLSPTHDGKRPASTGPKETG